MTGNGGEIGGGAAGLVLRPLRAGDEAAFRAGHAAMAAAGPGFGLGLEPGLDWDAYLRLLADHRAGRNLRQSLVIARGLGIDRVLVTCDDDNAGSAAVIEANGGRLENVVATGAGQPPKRRYWIG